VLVVAIAVVMVFGGFVNGVTPPMRNLPAFMKGLAALSYNRCVHAVLSAPAPVRWRGDRLCSPAAAERLYGRVPISALLPCLAAGPLLG
jgi:ribose/xylose/arabinose/galactoside ABC-type transport system permease subunit